MAEGRLDAANAKAAGELETRRAAVENLVEPLKETLARVETQLSGLDAERVRSHAALAEQVNIARQSSEQLKIADPGAGHRAAAAGGPRPLGRDAAAPGGGAGRDELTLRLRGAGASVVTDDGALRPDMVVRLAGGKNIVVDSKVSLAAYLEAAEATDESSPPDEARGARPAPARARRPAGRQGVLDRAQPGAGVRRAVHPGRGVPGPGPGA